MEEIGKRSKLYFIKKVKFSDIKCIINNIPNIKKINGSLIMKMVDQSYVVLNLAR